MPRSWLSETEEYTGPVPSGGYKLTIEEVERGVNGENANVPGARRYMAVLRIVEPKKYAGTVVRDYFTIGTEDDPKGRDQETWRTSLGAKRLVRLLKRAGVAARDGDDEEWQDAAQGQEVCAHVMRETDERGTRNSINGNYFRETDEDFVGVGEVLEAPSRGGGGGARGARGSDKPARGGNGAIRNPARAARPPVDDDDDDEAPPARRGKPPADDEEEGEKEEQASKPAAKAKAAPKGGRKLPAKGDDDDDEDED